MGWWKKTIGGIKDFTLEKKPYHPPSTNNGLPFDNHVYIYAILHEVYYG